MRPHDKTVDIFGYRYSIRKPSGMNSLKFDVGHLGLEKRLDIGGYTQVANRLSYRARPGMKRSMAQGPARDCIAVLSIKKHLSGQRWSMRFILSKIHLDSERDSQKSKPVIHARRQRKPVDVCPKRRMAKETCVVQRINAPFFRRTSEKGGEMA